jgi:tRNA A37 threonylcarbamoyladenosine dehydratase
MTMSHSEHASRERRFTGVARLYGAHCLEHFRHSHVCVAGVGGVGSWAVESLARSGIGRLTLIDADHVAESNINRQLQALTSTLGTAKVQTLSQRLLEIDANCQIQAVEEMLEMDNLTECIPHDCDYLLDCIDNYRVKAALIAHCKQRRLKLITVGGAGGKRDPGKIRQADLSRTEQDPLLAKTRKQLRQHYAFPQNPKRRFSVPCIYSAEQARNDPDCAAPRDSSLNCAGFGSSMAVTATFGLFAAAWVLNSLAEQANPPDTPDLSTPCQNSGAFTQP